MAGIVFSPDAPLLGRYGTPVAVAAGGVIPTGTWYVDGAWTLTAADGTTHNMEAGYCISDGVSAVLTAAGFAVPLGG